MPATAPVWKANGTAVSGTGAITVNAPASHAIGDFLLLLVNTSNQAVATPSGWNDCGAGAIGVGTAAAADSAGLQVFWKFAATTTESASVADSGDHTLGIIVSYTGVSTVNPINAFGTRATDTTNTTTPTLAAVTTTKANCRVVQAISTGQESAKSGWANTDLSSYTARGFGTTTSGVDGGVACADGVKASAGAVGLWQVTCSITSKACAITVALQPVDFEQSITVAGIASAEAVGTHAVSGGAVVVSGALATGYVGIAYNDGLQASGGAAGGYTWSVSAGALPGWASLNPGTSDITGNPTAGATTFTLRATDSSGTNYGELEVTLTIVDFAVDDGYQVITYTGDGAATKTLTTAIDLSAGGYVRTSNLAGTASVVNYLSDDGTNIFRKQNGDSLTTNPTTASGAVFGNGTLTLDAAGSNASGQAYVAHIFRKHPLICDVVRFTGNAASNRAVTHSLGVAPAFVGSWGLGGYQWWTGHTKDQYSGQSGTHQYKTTLAGIWGTTDPDSSSFYVGGATSNPNSINLLYLLLPSSSSFLEIGAFTGTGTVPNTTAVDPGWPVQTYLYGLTGPAWYVLDEARDDEGFTGTDTRLQLSSGAISTTTDLVASTSAGVTLNNNATYAASVSYTYLAIRRAPPPGDNITVSGIASAEAWGSATVTNVGGIIISGTPADTMVGAVDSTTLELAGGDGSYTVTVDSGSLPTGWALATVDADTVTVGGTALAAGTYVFTLRAADGTNPDKLREFTVLVEDSSAYVDIVTWVGDGNYPRTIPTSFALNSGAFVLVTRSASTSWAAAAYVKASGGGNPYSFRAASTDVLRTGLSFDADGLTISTSADNMNLSGFTYVAVVIKKHPELADIVSWTGNDAADRAISHSLGATPQAMLINSGYWRDAGAADPDTNVALRDGTVRTVGDFNNVHASSTQFVVDNVASSGQYNSVSTGYHAVLLANKASGPAPYKSGTYVGNGSSSGPTLTLGFRARSIIVLPAGLTYASIVGTPGNEGFGATQLARNIGDEVSSQTEASGTFFSRSETGLQVVTTSTSFNESGRTYHYLALRDGETGQTISPAGIASAETWPPGSPQLVPGPVSVAPSGIASAEAFGTAQINQGVTATGIAGAEAFGTATIGHTLATTGIASAEGWGTPTITGATQNIAPAGIASGEAFGAATLTAQSFITATGIASAQAMGTPTVVPGSVTVSPAGIASAEAFGNAALSASITLQAAGIASGETFGMATVAAGTTILPNAIASGEAWGVPTVAAGAVQLAAAGLASAEAWGNASVSAAAIVLSPAAIASAEAWGAPVVSGVVVISVPALASAEGWGTPSVSVGAVTLEAAAIASAESFGAASISTGAVALAAEAVASGEAWGLPAVGLVADRVITVQSIVSSEAWGAGAYLIVQSFADNAAVQRPDSWGDGAVARTGESVVEAARAFGPMAPVLRHTPENTPVARDGADLQAVERETTEPQTVYRDTPPPQAYPRP